MTIAGSHGSLTRIGFLVVVVALMFSASAISTSSQPAGETYYGCLMNYRFLWVNTSANLPCSPPGRVISWNEDGQLGLPGPVGPQGPQGLQGEPGTPGTTTLTGAVQRDADVIASSGFSVVRESNGVYTITPDPGIFSGTRLLVPVVMVSSGRNEVLDAEEIDRVFPGTTSFTVEFSGNTAFTFMVSETIEEVPQIEASGVEAPLAIPSDDETD